MQPSVAAIPTLLLPWFQGMPLDDERMAELQSLLKQKEYRVAFARALNQQRSHYKKLNPLPFEQLAVALRAALERCSDSHEFSVAKTLVNMAATFHVGEARTREFVQCRLRGLPVLRNVRLWEELFFDACAAERRHFDKGAIWKQLPLRDQHEAVVRFKNAIFGQLGTFAFNMIETGVDPAEVRTFAGKMCQATELPDDDAAQLMASIELVSSPPSEYATDRAFVTLLSSAPISSDLLLSVLQELSERHCGSACRIAVLKLSNVSTTTSLCETSFGQLCVIIGAILNAVVRTQEFSVAAGIARNIEHIVCEAAELTLFGSISSHEIWSDARVWKAALRDESLQLTARDPTAQLLVVCQCMTALEVDPADVRKFAVQNAPVAADPILLDTFVPRARSRSDTLTDPPAESDQVSLRSEKEQWLSVRLQEWHNKQQRRRTTG